MASQGLAGQEGPGPGVRGPGGQKGPKWAQKGPKWARISAPGTRAHDVHAPRMRIACSSVRVRGILQGQSLRGVDGILDAPDPPA